MKTYSVTVAAHQISRLCLLLLQNQVLEDRRSKNWSGIAITGEIYVQIHRHIKLYEEKGTHCGRKPRKYADAEFNLVKNTTDVCGNQPDLEFKMKYNFDYTNFKENFEYALGRSQMDACNKCESLVTKMRELALCQYANTECSYWT